MRSGLQNPGAIPLLAVLVAALLSIMPIVCEALTKLDDAPEQHSVESNIYAAVGSVPARSEPALPPSSLARSSSNPIIRTCSNRDTLWQQVCQMATTFVLSSNQQDTTHKLRRSRFDLAMPHPEPLQNLPRILFDDGKHNYSTKSSHSIADSTSITISLTSFSGVPDNQRYEPSTLSSPLQSSPSIKHPSSSATQPKSAVVNASSPVDRKSSYMAILVSLVVAIMWF